MTTVAPPNPAPGLSAAAPQSLFVTWQDPETHRYWPVGRLRAFGPNTAERFEFVYLGGAYEARQSGFHGFIGFPDFERVYRDDVLFPLFANRVMNRRRPDFGEYVNRLDLDPNDADDLDILARSGGRRNTDSIEVFPAPDLHRDGCYITWFLVHGVRHSDPDLQRLLHEKLREDEPLYLQADFQNLADAQALSLRTAAKLHVGYLPRYLVPDAWELFAGQEVCGWNIEVTVAQINPPPAPIQQRVLCRMMACWPDGFEPYASKTYLPIPPVVDG